MFYDRVEGFTHGTRNQDGFNDALLGPQRSDTTRVVTILQAEPVAESVDLDDLIQN